MKRLFSIWLVPSKSDDKTLQSIVNLLSKTHNSPVFKPHLTLIGDVSTTLENLQSAIENVFVNQPPFKVKAQGLNQSDAFFKTVFIEFEVNKVLKNLFQALSQRTDMQSIDNFKPHISLIYKLMPEKRKNKIIKGLNIKNEYTIGAVYIVSPKVGDKDWMDVETWRILYKKDLT